MVISISTKITKSYCFNCDKMTETKDKKQEKWKQWYILKGICEVCNTNKVEKEGLINEPCNLKKLI